MSQGNYAEVHVHWACTDNVFYFLFFKKKKVRTSDSQVSTSKTFALLPEANHLVSSQKLLKL